MDSDKLKSCLEMARRSLAVLEEQVAGYTALTIPAHLQIDLEDKRREVDALNTQLQQSPLSLNNTIPNNLPPQFPAPFVRETDAKEVQIALQQPAGSPLIVIQGAPAMGKTELAREVAERSKEFFKGIVWFEASYEPQDIQQLLSLISSVLRPDIPPQDHDACSVAEVERLLREGPYLIVVTKLLPEAREVIEFLHTIPSPNKVLITTTGRLPKVRRTVVIDKLELAEALLLVRKVAEIYKHLPLLQVSDEELRPLCEECDCSPIALLWAVGEIIFYEQPLEVVLADLRYCRADFYKMWQHYYGLLDREARRLLHLVSVFDDSVSWEALHAPQLNKDPDEVDLGIRQLVVLALLKGKNLHTSDKYYEVHRLIRQYVLTQLEEVEVKRLRLQVANYLKGVVLENGRENWERYPALERELKNILGSFEWCIEHQEWERALELHTGFYYFLGIRGLWRDKLRCARHALRAAQELKNFQEAALILIRGIGWTEMKQGNLMQAERHILQGLEICTRQEYLEGQMSAQRYLGTVYRKRGKFELAAKHYEKSLQIGDHVTSSERERLLGGTYVSYGTLAWRRGNYKIAQKRYEKALAVFRALGHRPKVAGLLSRIANLLYVQGEFDQAKQMFEESQKIADNCFRQNTRAYNFYGLARLCYQEGDYKLALEYLNRSRELFRQLAIAHEAGEETKIKGLHCELVTLLDKTENSARN